MRKPGILWDVRHRFCQDARACNHYSAVAVVTRLKYLKAVRSDFFLFSTVCWVAFNFCAELHNIRTKVSWSNFEPVGVIDEDRCLLRIYFCLSSHIDMTVSCIVRRIVTLSDGGNLRKNTKTLTGSLCIELNRGFNNSNKDSILCLSRNIDLRSVSGCELSYDYVNHPIFQYAVW